MRKYPIHVTRAQGKIPNTLCITWESKWKKLWKTIYNSKYTQKCSKLLQLKMYICNYTLEFPVCSKNMKLLKLDSKKKTKFFWLEQVAIYQGQMSNKC